MMAWTPEHRRRYAPAIEHVVRSNAITRGTNSAAEDLRRLHTLVVEAQPSFPFAGIASADVIQRIEREGSGGAWPTSGACSEKARPRLSDERTEP
jgi:hypothetical protein